MRFQTPQIIQTRDIWCAYSQLHSGLLLNRDFLQNHFEGTFGPQFKLKFPKRCETRKTTFFDCNARELRYRVQGSFLTADKATPIFLGTFQVVAK